MVRTEATESAVQEGSPAAATGSDAAVSIRGLHHCYGELQTIENLDLELTEHEVIGLVGPSGCGKSTLLELVCGLQEPSGGALEVGGGRTAAERLAACAFMPQHDVLLPWLSAIDNASLALRSQGSRRREARADAAELFARFGLDGFEAALPRELSGGMRQRVAFLRTLLSGKPVLALDEPFASLDAITRGEMQAWLARALSDDPRAVVLVTHDVEEALYLCDRVAVLSARPGQIVDEMAAPAPRAPDRDAAVTAPEFVAARERATAALRKGMR
ncbi:MAG TPA: ABC transporter ATP-binding protein [Solirubrobacterales bacterium]|nr:ABC transporter ATP-binding protein [Solirubrobacterales bacterium]